MKAKKDKAKKKQNDNINNETRHIKKQNRKNQHSRRERSEYLLEDFKTQQRKKDIMFLIFIIVIPATIIGGYFINVNYFESDSGTNDDLDISPGQKNNGNNNGDQAGNGIVWYDYNEGLTLASQTNKPVMIDFYYDDCVWCVRLEEDTYSDQRVIVKSEQFVNVKVDLYEKNDYDGQKITENYDITGWPTIVYLDPSGEEIKRISGYKAPDPFLDDMDDALSLAGK